ncbi:hypothetical protein [Nocardia mikamii]|uniref:hypothetical protein n=1 Tax=Nocardia mikamii TaxID=508464 RepID=UPI0012F4919B|nr:hypothetical protein [Nocardia mikamii]
MLIVEGCHRIGCAKRSAGLWTRAMIDRCDIHPWLCDLPIRGAPVTPHLLGWTEAILKVLSGAGLSPSESLGCALLLDGYARQIANARRGVRENTATSVRSAAVTRFLEPRMRELGYSVLAAMMAGNEYSDDILDDDIAFCWDEMACAPSGLRAGAMPSLQGFR